MYCSNCGSELADDTKFCPKCGNKIKTNHKNIYLALILSFFITGLGSIYAGKTKKGLILLTCRLLFAIIGTFINIFFLLSVFVWVFGFYECYKDIQIANGNTNPKLIKDFRNWNQNQKIICILIICIILIFMISGFIGFISMNNYSSDDTNTNYYLSDSSDSSSSSHSSHYSGVDTSPNTIAKNDPDWYYEHYEYGDNPDIDDYLESEGYD